MPTGDRPRFGLAKQRLDKVDVEAISDLVQEQVLRTVGALLGPAEGFLSEVTFSYTAPYLTVSECRLAYASYVSGSTLVMDGGVVTFRPDLHPLAGRRDLSPLGGNPGYLFFKRTEVDSDEENRAYFDVITQQKKVGLTNTRFRERVDWEVANDLTTLTQATGWNLCARITWPSPSSPQVVPIWAGEFRDASGVPQNVMRSYGDGGLGVSWRENGVAAQPPAGILRYLQQLVGIVQHMLDRTFTLNNLGQATGALPRANRWTLTTLERDLGELHNDLAAAESQLLTLTSTPSDIALLQEQIAVPSSAPCIFSGVKTVGPTTFAYKDPKGLLLSHASGGTGEYILNFDLSGTLLGDPGPFIQAGSVSVILTVMGSAARRDTIATYEWTGAGQITVWTHDVSVAGPADAEFSIAIFPTV